jgi:hypothetical protein
MAAWTNAAKADAVAAVAGAGLKVALYTGASAVDATTAAYTATGEVTDTNIPAGGLTLSGRTLTASDGSVATAGADWDPPAPVTPVASKTFRKILIYDPARTNRTVYFHDYGSDQVWNAGTAYTLVIPGTGTYLITLA